MEKSEWYPLHVRPRFELIVAFRLWDHDIEHYLPLRRLTRESAGTVSCVELPLLPGFIFCKVPPGAVRSLLLIPGVLDVAGDLNSARSISEQKMKDFTRIVDAGISVQPWKFTLSGRTVQIQNGPLKGITGVLDDTKDVRILVVSIESIRRSVAIQLDDRYTFSRAAGMDTAA